MLKVLTDYQQIGVCKQIAYINNNIPKNTQTSIFGWKCLKCNHIWQTSYEKIKSKTGCPNCYGNAPKKLIDYQNIATSNNSVYILSYIPTNTSTSIEGWQCKKCAFVWKTTYRSMNSRHKCPKCAQNLPKTHMDYKAIGNDRGINYILNIIPSNIQTSILGWQCRICAYKWQTSYASVSLKRGCPNCSGLRTKTLIDYQNLAQTCAIKYINNNIPKNTSTSIYGWKCVKCSCIWSAKYNNIQQGSGCPQCACLKSEAACRVIFESIFQKKFPRVRPDFLRYGADKRSNLELDGYNSELQLAFEYQGEQHYRFLPYFHDSKQDFEQQQSRDAWKKTQCANKKINLIEIPYNYSFANIDKLTQFIQTELKTYSQYLEM